MAEPKLLIEQRVERLERAVEFVSKLFGDEDVYQQIEKILRGEEVKAEKEDISSSK